MAHSRQQAVKSPRRLQKLPTTASLSLPLPRVPPHVVVVVVVAAERARAYVFELSQTVLLTRLTHSIYSAAAPVAAALLLLMAKLTSLQLKTAKPPTMGPLPMATPLLTTLEAPDVADAADVDAGEMLQIDFSLVRTD